MTLWTIILSGSVGIIASLLTIFLTPRLQHYFWKRQRLAELRFDAIEEINELTAEFITGYIDTRNNSADSPQLKNSFGYSKPRRLK